MMKTIKALSIILVICSFFHLSSVAQKSDLPPKRHTIYAEVFGQGVYYSINYDYSFLHRKYFFSSASAGYSAILSPNNFYLVNLPISYNTCFGKNGHYLEIGVGLTPVYLKELSIPTAFVSTTEPKPRTPYYADDFYLSFTPKLGYRFQRYKGGLFFKVSFTPYMNVLSIPGDVKIQKDAIPEEPNPTIFVRKNAFYDSNFYVWGGISVGWTL